MVKETDVGHWADLHGRITDPDLVATPIPALIVILTALQVNKGSVLSEAEVLRCRDEAVCMVFSRAVAAGLPASRGYHDIDMENPWPHWQAYLTGEESP